MNDNSYSGGQVMIKIDGSKIKQIREQKGLTQLYIATVVEVTTDTVSRWENKRYPSIKKENGIKLAEALEVNLEDILEVEKLPDDADGSPLDAGNGTAQEELQQNQYPEKAPKRILPSKAMLSLVVFIALAAFTAIILFKFNSNLDQTETVTSVRRTVPPHFVAGRPFPVFLSISGQNDTPVSLILRETIPPGVKVEATFPPVSDKHKKNGSIQWLEKVNGSAVFVYIVLTDPSFAGSLSFEGKLKPGGAPNSPEINIIGTSSTTAGLYHWADSNRDNRISDEEILTVYDLIDKSTHAQIDMELLEEIWLGNGYIWHPQKQRFSIIE